MRFGIEFKDLLEDLRDSGWIRLDIGSHVLVQMTLDIEATTEK